MFYVQKMLFYKASEKQVAASYGQGRIDTYINCTKPKLDELSEVMVNT